MNGIFTPQYELTLTLNSYGERYVADQIQPYHELDLTLLGPNLPHTWESSGRYDEAASHKVYVLWFDQALAQQIGQVFVEFDSLEPLLRGSHQGLFFPPETAQALLPLFEQLDQASAQRRLTLLLEILSHLCEGEVPVSLGVAGAEPGVEIDSREQQVLSRLLETLHAGYTQPLQLGELAQQMGMSESTLTRFFRRHMGQGVNKYLTRVRLGRACSLLSRTDLSVQLVGQQAGFPNQANFNRLFRKYKQMTPREFRTRFKRD